MAVARGKLDDARARFDELFGLVGDRKIRDASLRSELAEARENSAKVTAELAARSFADQRIKDAEKRKRDAEEQVLRDERDAKDALELAAQAKAEASRAEQRNIHDRIEKARNDPVLSSLMDDNPFLRHSIEDYLKTFSPIAQDLITTNLDVMLATGKIRLSTHRYVRRALFDPNAEQHHWTNASEPIGVFPPGRSASEAAAVRGAV